MKKPWRVIILGAAGRDFHNFNVLYRRRPTVQVTAFTANQIPGIAGRKYPSVLAGRLYPQGIPIEEESNLEKLIKDKRADECLLSYSDLSYPAVMRLASRVLAAGAKFSMMGAIQTMLTSRKPVVAVLAVRTGCGKSQTSRAVAEILQKRGKKVVLVRHPMPYGDLSRQAIQRFQTLADLQKHHCTIEEREEYEPHLARGGIVYAGVDYEAILKQAEKEAEIIIWDGGNNDTSFFRPSLSVTVTDPLRAGQEISYYPGEVNLRLAQIVIINKIDAADPLEVVRVEKNIRAVNPGAKIIKSESVIKVDRPEVIKGKKVVVVEDGPTLTHGGMTLGAGVIAARRFGAVQLINPWPYAVGSLKQIFKNYPSVGSFLPAMGYGEKQMRELETTINRTNCQVVVVGTPVDLAGLIKIRQPIARVSYELSPPAKTQLKTALLTHLNFAK